MLLRRLVSPVVVLLALAGCAQTGRPGQSTDDKITVVAAFYPLAEAAQRIGGGAVEVHNLTPPGTEPHDLELTTDQLDRVIDADVVLYFGRGFQPAMEEAVDRAEGEVLDVLDGEELAEGEADEHGEEDGEHAEDEATLDPHIWLDPQRWAKVMNRIGDALAEADSDRADEFATGTRTYAGEIEDLDGEFEEGLGDCDRDLIVTSHAAFAYLAERYGLEQESISGVSPEAEPDPEHLAELADTVDEHGVTTIFTETLVSPDVAETLARETGVEVATLNPIEGLTSEEIENDEDYASVMSDNLGVLREGLGCS
ncbi:MAG: zinc ABC transporter substrate-binding protein [Actinomycetota bacterium]